jgi:hypothetical protein
MIRQLQLISTCTLSCVFVRMRVFCVHVFCFVLFFVRACAFLISTHTGRTNKCTRKHATTPTAPFAPTDRPITCTSFMSFQQDGTMASTLLHPTAHLPPAATVDTRGPAMKMDYTGIGMGISMEVGASGGGGGGTGGASGATAGSRGVRLSEETEVNNRLTEDHVMRGLGVARYCYSTRQVGYLNAMRRGFYFFTRVFFFFNTQWKCVVSCNVVS